VAHALYLHGRKTTLSHIVLYAAQLTFLLLTFSRGAIVAVALFGTSFSLLSLRKRPQPMFALVGVLTVIVATLMLTEAGGMAKALLFRTEVGSSGRDVAWQYGIEAWTNGNVFFGTGSFRGVEQA